MSELPPTLQPLRAKKPTLLDLWMSYHFDLSMLAKDAVVSADTVQRMYNSLPVPQEDAAKVLEVLAEHYHQNYTLETVYVVTVKPVNKSAVARMRALINAQNEAAQQGLYGLAKGTSEHEIITAKVNRLGEQFEELKEVADIDTVMQFMIEEWNAETGGITPQ